MSKYDDLKQIDDIASDSESLIIRQGSGGTTTDAATLQGHPATDFLAPQYVVMSVDTNLTGERALTAGTLITKTDGGAGSTVTIAVSNGSAQYQVPITQGSPFTPAWTALSDTAGAGLAFSGGAFAVGAGNGITVNANDVALTTPGTLAVDSTNGAAGNHTHAITSSSAPGAQPRILASGVSGYLELVRLGLGVTPGYPLHVAGATEQARIEYNATNYLSVTVDSVGSATLGTQSSAPGGNLTLYPEGNILVDPTGRYLSPVTNYDVNLGSLATKYLTLHCAELWVETLVAQDTIATIGGRVLVGPTTTLTRDLGAGVGDTTIYVKHNQMVADDTAYMEADGKVEFFAIASAATDEGDDYSYTVTRNLDGSGRNLWYAGDAMFNTGQVGNGFIDLYSLRSVHYGASEFGPTIVGNVRNSTTYNDWSKVWAIGNLNGLYAYATTTYGAAFGKYANDESFLTVDATNGIRMQHRAAGADTVLAQWDTAGALRIGELAAGKSNLYAYSGALQLRNNTTVAIDLQSDGDVFIGSNVAAAATTYLAVLTNAQTYNGEAFEAGDMLIGDNTASKANIFWDKSTGQLKFRGGTTIGAYISTLGGMAFGTGKGYLDSAGITLSGGETSYQTYNAVRWMTTAEPPSGNEVGRITSGLFSSSLPVVYVDANRNKDYASSVVRLTAWGNGATDDGSGAIEMTGADHSGFVGIGATSEVARYSVIRVYSGAADANGYMTFLTNAAERMRLEHTRLTFDQGTADGEILALKSTGDVAHGMTALAETETFGQVMKYSGDYGGLAIRGFADLNYPGLALYGFAVSDETTKGVGASGYVRVLAAKKSTTTITSPGANANLFVISDASSGEAKFIVDEEGDILYDGTSSAYDDLDDVALCETLDATVTPETALQTEWDEWTAVNRALLQAAGVVHYNEDGHHFVSGKKLARLHNGAIRQLAARVERLEAREA